MVRKKRSFLERLTGSVSADDDFDASEVDELVPAEGSDWSDAAQEAQLTVDVFQTPDDIIVKTIVAGVDPDDLDIQISREMVTIKGTRSGGREISGEDYFHRELFWGSFSRTILLPEEIDVESSVAEEKNGLLTIKLPKVDKKKQTKLRVKRN